MNWYEIFKFSNFNFIQYNREDEVLIRTSVEENGGTYVGPQWVDDDPKEEITGYIAVEPTTGSSLLIQPGEDVKQRFVDKVKQFKLSFKLDNFEDRNILNANIRDLKDIAKVLAYLRKYVYMNAPHARRVIHTIAQGKKMSTYPKIKEILMTAHKKALDNYKAFAEICDAALQKIYHEIKDMEKERNDFANKVLPKRLRERENHGSL
jgi:hypothetical protein